MLFYDPFSDKWYEQIEEQIDFRLPEKISLGDKFIVSYPFVDLHTHVRLNNGEDYNSLTKAAIVGGFGAMNIQPNTNPPLDEWNVLNDHTSLSKDELVKYLYTVNFFGGISDISAGPLDIQITGFSTDGIRYNSQELVESYRNKKVALLFDHSQLHEIAGDFYTGTNLPNAIRPYSNEAIAINKTVLLGLEFGFNKFHIQHVSTAKSLDEIEHLRRFANVTCEVTPHHIFFIPEMIDNPNQKINPPISKDRDLLIDAVKKGFIDTFSTDHAPHPEKPNDFERAPYGSSHIEVAFSVYYTVFNDLQLVIRKLTVDPLRVIGRCYEDLGMRFPNDLIILNTEDQYIVDSNKLYSMGKNCAFNGYKLKGKVFGVRINGKWVYWNGTFIDN
ncbi:MAG TPA: dihydroorotase [Fervidobacterium sp.]|nr:dihydroorotase [Fervidobacterium sp.]HPT54144.1 dihydroorotase [Fervidobacterium sp.]HPZ17334.1 dihydroorotase [Fervidobacterium sp.]HQE48063.1 dihydroorotase [Fervidobacterium sp.]HUM41856.1 dihydroorotase [Fervidobacterium sp.]